MYQLENHVVIDISYESFVLFFRHFTVFARSSITWFDGVYISSTPN